MFPTQSPARPGRWTIKLRELEVGNRGSEPRPIDVHYVHATTGCPRLNWTDPATGTPVKISSRDKHRYEHPPVAGNLVHVEVK